jgi:hypothetical protein
LNVADEVEKVSPIKIVDSNLESVSTKTDDDPVVSPLKEMLPVSDVVPDVSTSMAEADQIS